MNVLLPISSTLALALLVWHSWKRRGGAADLARSQGQPRCPFRFSPAAGEER